MRVPQGYLHSLLHWSFGVVFDDVLGEGNGVPFAHPLVKGTLVTSFKVPGVVKSTSAGRSG